jgi:hypothetical protein
MKNEAEPQIEPVDLDDMRRRALVIGGKPQQRDKVEMARQFVCSYTLMDDFKDFRRLDWRERLEAGQYLKLIVDEIGWDGIHVVIHQLNRENREYREKMRAKYPHLYNES